MAKSPIFYWTSLSFLLVSASADQKIITAESGKDVTLTCRAPNKNSILIVEWNRPDQVPEYVLLYRDEQFDSDDQHPSFKNRVDLQDRQMKDGDVSLILKNVTINDTGTYECRVFRRGTNRWKRANFDIKPINTTKLVVAPPGPTGGRGRPGLIIAGICVAVMFLVAAVMSVIALPKTQKKKKSPLPAPPDKEVEQQLV